jgi:hypothetical protein
MAGLRENFSDSADDGSIKLGLTPEELKTLDFFEEAFPHSDFKLLFLPSQEPNEKIHLHVTVNQANHLDEKVESSDLIFTFSVEMREKNNETEGFDQKWDYSFDMTARQTRALSLFIRHIFSLEKMWKGN